MRSPEPPLQRPCTRPCTKRGVEWTLQEAHAAASCLYEQVDRWIGVARKITRSLDLAEEAVHDAIMIVETTHLVRSAQGLLQRDPLEEQHLVAAFELSALDDGFKRIVDGLDQPEQGYVQRRLAQTARARLESDPRTNTGLAQVRVLLARARDLEQVIGALAQQEREQAREITRGGRVAREIQISLLGRLVNGLLEQPAPDLDDDRWRNLLRRLVDGLLGQRDPEGGFNPASQTHDVPCKLRPWFRTILAHEAQRLRSQHQPPPTGGGPGGAAGPPAPAGAPGDGIQGAPGAPFPDDDIEFLDHVRRMANLQQVFDALNARQRHHFQLILKHGLDYGAGVIFARELGIKPGAQRTAWFRLKNRIRNVLAAMLPEAEA